MRQPNEIKRLQGCINDQIRILALPALRTGQESEQIVGTVLDVLIGMLRLDFAYARLNQPGASVSLSSSASLNLEMHRSSPKSSATCLHHILQEVRKNGLCG